MAIRNSDIKPDNFLREMYNDDFFPDFLVDKIKAILIDLCESIETNKPKNATALLDLTHAATEKINALADAFDENNSELETVAREVMAENIEFIVRAYGFNDIDIEDMIAPRDW